ncbi:MAG TPA: metal-dependent hydrolase [Candidatus Rifleibacterium sp.]|nr:metal-dependent hydrolase [Candidatus Rifleibacterium sp.]HPT47156.1 metal-dependent hydrolase [Candidatus Rifleibacterium sp.]
MKGFTHFISGIAVASFFPQAVHMASQEQSFILCLGGIFGIMPDTLDFKFARYFHKSDFEIRPDPANLDARVIAAGVANAINKAIAEGRGTVQLHTMQLASNRWRSYTLGFDSTSSEVVVEIGPEVDTGQIPFEGTELKDPLRASARVKVNCEFFQQFDKKSQIAIMTGPCFEFVKRPTGKVEIVFLPWHRTWSHSFTLGILIALLVGIFTFFTVPEGPNPELYSLPRWLLYPLIILFGSMVHIIEDSTGFMGNNLFYPFTKDRTNGLGLMSAAEAIPNFLFVWSSIVAILYNLDRFRWAPAETPAGISSPAIFFLCFYILPVAVMAYFFFKGKREKAVRHESKTGSVDFDGQTSVERETDASVI